MKKFLINYILTMLFLIIFTFNASVFATYVDIDGHWAEETITKFVEKEYLTSGDLYFEPDSEISKGELVTIVNRYFDYGLAETQEENMKIAIEKGYLAGDNGIEEMTREDVAILICKILSLSPIEAETTFIDDSDIDLWAKGYVVALEKQQIMIGYPDQSYKPHKNMTKAEFVTVLNRCVGIGGADLEIMDIETDKLEIGIFELYDGMMKFKAINEEIELNSGDIIMLALKVPEKLEDFDTIFEISNLDIIEFDKELYYLEALKEGEADINIIVGEEKITFKVIVK